MRVFVCVYVKHWLCLEGDECACVCVRACVCMYACVVFICVISVCLCYPFLPLTVFHRSKPKFDPNAPDALLIFRPNSIQDRTYELYSLHAIFFLIFLYYYDRPCNEALIYAPFFPSRHLLYFFFCFFIYINNFLLSMFLIYAFFVVFLDRGKVLVPVVIDPMLAQKLRPHQKQGVQFLWNTVAVGQRLNNQLCQGCILADEMYVFLNRFA